MGLLSFLAYNNGAITNRQALEIGLSRERLRLLTNAGQLERVAPGLYISPQAIPDILYLSQLGRTKSVYSHATALFLHDLSDRDPLHYTVTLPQGYNTSALVADGYRVHTIRKELHGLGICKLKTIWGHHVTAYNMERTICDCIRSRAKMDIDIVSQALKRYARRSDKDIHLLMEYGGEFRIEEVLRNYLEVLL